MTDWLISADSNVYNHDGAFSKWGYIDWIQWGNYKTGDTVYIYSSKQDGYIKFITEVIACDLGFNEIQHDDEFWIGDKNVNRDDARYSRLKLVKRIDSKLLSLNYLRKYGLANAPQQVKKLDPNRDAALLQGIRDGLSKIGIKVDVNTGRISINKLPRISINDNISFKYNYEVMNACFGDHRTDYFQVATADSHDGCLAWFPKKEYIDNSGVIRSGAQDSNWKNHLEDDGKLIVSWLYDGEYPTSAEKEPSLSDRANSILHCFWCEDSKNVSYRYIGTFLLDYNSSQIRRRVYRRIATEIDLTKWYYTGGDISYTNFDDQGYDVLRKIYIEGKYKKQKALLDDFLSKQKQYSSLKEKYHTICSQMNSLGFLSDFEQYKKIYVPSVISLIKHLNGQVISTKAFSPDNVDYNTIGSLLVDIYSCNDNNHNKIIRNSILGETLTSYLFALFKQDLYLYSLPLKETEFYLKKLGITYVPNASLTDKHCLLMFWKECNFTMDSMSSIEFYFFLLHTFGACNERDDEDSLPVSRNNIAIKCNYCDGGKNEGKIGFSGVCRPETIAYNIEVEHREWCSNPRCPCYNFYIDRIPYSKLQQEMAQSNKFVCYESTMLTRWEAKAGMDSDGTTRTLKQVDFNKVCILTTRFPDTDESQRKIFALFIVDDYYVGDDEDEGYVKCLSEHRIELTEEETSIMDFWEYYKSPNSELVSWSWGLFRYVDDATVFRLINDILSLRLGTELEYETRNFLEYFCEKNSIALETPERNSDANHVNTIEKEKEITSITADEVSESERLENEMKEPFVGSDFDSDLEFDYVPHPEDKLDVVASHDSKGVSAYPRDPQKRMNALKRAHFKCELNSEHKTFISKSTNMPYLETHHLIPLEFWKSFNKSLDVEANIMGLCSNCHNEIHYGKNSDELIKALYEKRKEELNQADIEISLSTLMKMYNGDFIV